MTKRKPLGSKDDRFFAGLGVVLGLCILVGAATQPGNYFGNAAILALWMLGGIVGTAILFGAIALFTWWVDRGHD